MLTAYLDECGQEKRGLVIVGGFIGNDEQWKQLASEWPKGFNGSQRKTLHMASLKFKHGSERGLLARLGPIPRSCGLQPIFGSVNVADYYDLVEGTVAEVHAHGYAVAMMPLIRAIEAAIPEDESYKLVFESQEALGFYRDKWLDFLSYVLSHPPVDRQHIRRPTLIGWDTVAKGKTCLCEPADYLCYHLAHIRHPQSRRALWTQPIIGDGSITLRHLVREEAREIFNPEIALEQENPEHLAEWRAYLRRGEFDPWQTVLDEKKRLGGE